MLRRQQAAQQAYLRQQHKENLRLSKEMIAREKRDNAVAIKQASKENEWLAAKFKQEEIARNRKAFQEERRKQRQHEFIAMLAFAVSTVIPSALSMTPRGKDASRSDFCTHPDRAYSSSLRISSSATSVGFSLTVFGVPFLCGFVVSHPALAFSPEAVRGDKASRYIVGPFRTLWQ